VRGQSSAIFEYLYVYGSPSGINVQKSDKNINIDYFYLKKLKYSPDSLRLALRNGHPSIETVGGSESLDMTTWMLNPGEERIVARRIKEILLT
jgi:hypothetical protein